LGRNSDGFPRFWYDSELAAFDAFSILSKLSLTDHRSTTTFEAAMKKGVLLAIGAYGIWALFPIYWKALIEVPAIQIIGHRIVWSFLFLSILLLVRKEWGQFRQEAFSTNTVLLFTLSGCLLAVNWLTYIWGVNAGLVIETSLGYFINPLVSVLLGTVFLREKLRPLQWLPVGLAALGVLYLTVQYGSVPWIALVLAFTFGTYGLLRKTAPLGSLYGLTLETLILTVPAALFLLFAEAQGVGVIGRVSPGVMILLVLTGVITALPLLMFSSAARQIHLSTLGILQYIAPTGQFLLGVLVYREPFTPAHLVGFGLIWTALILYTLEGLLVRRGEPVQNAPPPYPPPGGQSGAWRR
jgi:chloramphenicol-sensitive protein RarD